MFLKIHTLKDMEYAQVNSNTIFLFTVIYTFIHTKKVSSI